jgi:hypothetical protein
MPFHNIGGFRPEAPNGVEIDRAEIAVAVMVATGATGVRLNGVVDAYLPALDAPMPQALG